MSPHRFRFIAARVLRLFIALAVIPAGIFTALASLFPGWWIGDLVCHFRLQYLVIGALALPLLYGLQSSRLALFALIAVVGNAWPVWHYFEPPVEPVSVAQAAPNNAVSFRIAAANVFYRNSNYDAVAAWLRRHDADLTILLEATPQWRDALRTRLGEDHFIYLVTKPGRSGKLIIAKERPNQMQALGSKSHRSPTPAVTIAKNGARLTVMGVHTSWPMGATRTARRDQSIRDIGRTLRRSTVPAVAIGDFNITPFSAVFHELVADGAVRRAAAGQGWLPTWPVFFPIAGIQIDHLLHTAATHVERFETGGGIGSDHRWLLADITVAPSR